MSRSIFRPYGPLWNMLNTITDVLGLSLCWLLCCLPIITIFPATAALYDAVVRGIRYREPNPYRRFFSTFRKEWKSGILSTLLWGVVLGFFGYLLAMLLYMAREDSSYTVYAGVYLAGMLLPIASACWSAAIISRFTFSFGALTKTALKFLIAHFLRSIAMAACTVVIVEFTRRYLIWVFAAPACTALVWSVFAEPVFAKYGASIVPKAPETD